MKVKDLVENNKTHEDFPCCTIIYKHSEEGLVKVYDRIDTDDTIKSFLSKQVEDWTGVFFPSYFTLSINFKGLIEASYIGEKVNEIYCRFRNCFKRHFLFLSNG